jgi:hypothetical protein
MANGTAEIQTCSCLQAPGSSTETLTWGSVNLQSLQKPHEMELEWECQNLKIDFLHDQVRFNVSMTLVGQLQIKMIKT